MIPALPIRSGFSTIPSVTRLRRRSASWLQTLGALCCLSVQILANFGVAAEPNRKVGQTRFTQQSGFFDQPFVLELTPSTAGVKIYVTLSGARPTERTGSIYAAPIKIVTTTVLRAAAFKDGLELPGKAAHSYLFLSG